VTLPTCVPIAWIAATLLFVSASIRKTTMQRTAITVAFTVFSALCLGGNVDPLDDGNAADNAMITWFDVGAPVGHLLLVRQSANSCVVRFTTFHRGHDSQPSTLFNSGEESFSAEYDWFYLKKSSAESHHPTYDRGHRYLSRRSSFGIGRLAFQRGEQEVECGTFKLAWFYPTRVGFNSLDSATDIGVELAPTRWKTIEQVNFEDPALRWYKLDESRKPILIPTDQLP
jgi:hypothetical protein